MQEARREVWFLLEADQIVEGVHPQDWCSGKCVIHNPSDHWMREYTLSFDKKYKAFVRTCKHGYDHQDPDERTYWTEQLTKGVMTKRTGPGKKLEALALEKLANYSCPACPCGCCDITARA